LPIELKRFGETCPQAGKKLFPSTFLAVNTGDFLDPSDPPVAIFLGYRLVRIGHSQSPHGKGYYNSLLLSMHPISLSVTEDISESALFICSSGHLEYSENTVDSPQVEQLRIVLSSNPFQ
jgi:hypothetical protein